MIELAVSQLRQTYLLVEYILRQKPRKCINTRAIIFLIFRLIPLINTPLLLK